MSRWEPGARERLVLAAVELFSEQGYYATTVDQIAKRAGVTKSTFFRHFPDKRELLSAGQETLAMLLADGIQQAPADAGPMIAVSAGLQRASTAMGPANRDLGPRIKAAIASSVELQERAALKNIGLAASMSAALRERGVPEPVAQLASELGVMALKRGYDAWAEGGSAAGDDLAPHAQAALDQLLAVGVELLK